MFSIKHTQLLAQCKDLKTEVVTGAEEHAETREEAGEKRNHRAGFISHGSVAALPLNA
jgi:hypothetical protein